MDLTVRNQTGKRCLRAVVAFLFTLTALPTLARAETLNQSCGGIGQPWTDQRFAAAKALYLDNYCGYCHSFSPVESRGIFGPEHNTSKAAAEHYISDAAYSGAATTAAGYLSESIAQPGVYMTPGYGATTHQMPAYEGMLTDTQIDELAAFLLVYGDCALSAS